MVLSTRVTMSSGYHCMPSNMTNSHSRAFWGPCSVTTQRSFYKQYTKRQN